MKTTIIGLFTLVLASLLVAGTQGQEKQKEKEVTLTGTILCAKCSLNQTDSCTTAIQVKNGDKTVTYLLQDKGNAESYHEPVCGGMKEMGTVTGTVTEKDGKKWIKPSKVEYSKK